ncbi:MAG TPA: hypothetical protein VGM09_26330 [Bradyrhizobium sp.]
MLDLAVPQHLLGDDGYAFREVVERLDLVGMKFALIVVPAIESQVPVDMMELSLKEREDFDLAFLTRAGFFCPIPVNPVWHVCSP